jgi:hypothetical protein
VQRKSTMENLKEYEDFGQKCAFFSVFTFDYCKENADTHEMHT